MKSFNYKNVDGFLLLIGKRLAWVFHDFKNLCFSCKQNNKERLESLERRGKNLNTYFNSYIKDSIDRNNFKSPCIP